MAFIDILVCKDGVMVLCKATVKGEQTIWKCGACRRGNVATAKSWEDLDIKNKCPVCKRKINFDILGK